MASRLELVGNNVGAGPTRAKLEDLRRFMAHAKSKNATLVIAGQEWGDRQDLAEQFLDEYETYRIVWQADTNAGRKTPILYDSAVLKKQTQRITITVPKGTYWGPNGKGEDRCPGKRLVQVRLRFRKGGAKVKVLNHHLVASAFSTGGQEGKNRRDSWAKQTDAFFDAVRRTKVPCVGGGDWNAARDNPALKEPPSWVWDSECPTHKKRCIDLYGHKKNSKIRLVDAGVFDTDGSENRDDHRAPWQLYEFG